MNKLTQYRFKELFLIAVFLACFFSTHSTWKEVSEIFIFKNGISDIYFGQFLKAQSDLLINFSNTQSGIGEITLEKNSENLAPLNSTNGYNFFKYHNGDMINNGQSKLVLINEGFLINKLGIDSWWSTEVARIYSSMIPIDRDFYLRITHPVELIFVNSDFTMIESHLVKSGVHKFNVTKFGKYSSQSVIYGLIFSLFCTSLFYICIRHYRSFLSIIKQIPLYSSLLAIGLIIEYLVVFPGMFNTDTVVVNLSDKSYNIWFSSAYMFYNKIIYSLYPHFIQLPSIILFYISSLYLASHLKKLRNGIFFIFLLGISQLFIPAFFTSIFVQQRIFVAIIVLYAAIIFSCCNLVDRGKIASISYGFLVFASLLRPEYWLIFFVLFLFDTWHRRNSLRLFSISFFTTFLCVVCLSFFVNNLLPRLHGTIPETVRPYYQLTALLNLAKPYVVCDNYNDLLSQSLETIGGLNNYCSMSAEKFYWRYNREYSQVVNANKIMEREISKRIIANPKPVIEYAFLNLGTMSIQEYWQIYNRYADKSNNVSNPHIKTADTFGLMPSYGWQSMPFRIIAKFFYFLSEYINVFFSLAILILLPPIFCRARLTIILNTTFLFITGAICFIVPVAQWYYIVFIPIWSGIIFPIDKILRSARYQKL